MRQHEVIFTDDNYRIAMRQGAVEVCIEHRCQLGVEGGRHEWHPHNWSVGWRAVRCSWCGTHPPEGLQAAFWFLKDENR